jgi:hypothetical protein
VKTAALHHCCQRQLLPVTPLLLVLRGGYAAVLLPGGVELTHQVFYCLVALHHL